MLGYTMMGGVRAVAWIDFIQGIIMVFGLVVVSVVAMQSLGGFSGMLVAVEKASPVTLEWMGGKSTAVFFWFDGWVVGHWARVPRPTAYSHPLHGCEKYRGY